MTCKQGVIELANKGGEVTVTIVCPSEEDAAEWQRELKWAREAAEDLSRKVRRRGSSMDGSWRPLMDGSWRPNHTGPLDVSAYSACGV